MNTTDPIRWFQLEPADAWFFRDGRPSNRNEDQSDLESQFPPNPVTVAGAFRAAIARMRGWNGRGSWNDDLKPVLGDGPDNLGQLSFTGPFIARDGRLLFPLPAHLLGKESFQDSRRSFTPVTNWLAPSPGPVISDLGEVHLPVPLRPFDKDERLNSPNNFYTDAAGFQKVLEGNPPEAEECIPLEDLFKHEPRIGIQRQPDTRATGENAMYSPKYIRLERGVSLLIGIRGLPSRDWPPPEIFPLGGESRLALCSELEQAPSWPQPPAIENGHAVLTLLTPACWPGPKWWGAGPGDPAYDLHADLTGTVSTATVDRPKLIGGWDSLNGGPLPLAPCAPPGSVWWLEKASDLPASPLQLGERHSCGFGLAALGRCPS